MSNNVKRGEKDLVEMQGNWGDREAGAVASGSWEQLKVELCIWWCSVFLFPSVQFLFGGNFCHLCKSYRTNGTVAFVLEFLSFLPLYPFSGLVVGPAGGPIPVEHCDVTSGVRAFQGHFWGEAPPPTSHQSLSIATCVFPMTPWPSYDRAVLFYSNVYTFHGSSPPWGQKLESKVSNLFISSS